MEQGKMEKISDAAVFQERVKQARVTVALFKTTWCRDCHYIEPFMPVVLEKYGERIHWLEIDRDDLPDLCSELTVLGIPSFIAFYDGKETIRFVSKLRKTQEEIEQWLDRVIEVSNELAR